MEETSKNEEQRKSPTFDELIAMRVSEEDARRKLAEIDIQLAQCQKDRAMIDQRAADIMWVRSVILRQALNGAEAKAEPEAK